MNQPDFESWLQTSFTVTGEHPGPRSLRASFLTSPLSPGQAWQLVGHLCHLLTGGNPQTVSSVAERKSS